MSELLHVLDASSEPQAAQSEATPPPTTASSVLTIRPWNDPSIKNGLALAVWYQTPGPAASRLIHLVQTVLIKVIIPPAQRSWRGVYWLHLVLLSVRPAVSLGCYPQNAGIIVLLVPYNESYRVLQIQSVAAIWYHMSPQVSKKIV